MVETAFARRVAWFGLVGALLGLAGPASADQMPTVTVHDGRVYLGTESVVDLPRGATDAKVRSIPVGAGELYHVQATDKDRPWEALVVARSKNPVLFSGHTGLGPGTSGDRTGSAIDIREGDPATVLVGEVSERASLCGQGMALLHPKMFLAKTGELAAVSMHRLSDSARAKAPRLPAATPSPEDPKTGAPILDLGQSSDGSLGHALLDGNPKTIWSETKKGDGHGEFVSFRVSGTTAIERVVFSLPGEDKEREIRSPKSVYVATDKGLFLAVFPKTAETKPGIFVVSFPAPQATTCLAIALDESFSPKPTQLAVSLSDISVTTALDLRSARDLASDLDGPGGESVASYLERVQDKKLMDVLGNYDSFGPAGRVRALRVALDRPGCADQGPFLVSRLVDPDKQARERARAKLERCGKGATDALQAGLTGPAGGEAAALLALIAPSQAVLPIEAALTNAPAAARTPFRSALSRALRSVSPEVLTQVLARAAGAEGEVDVLRAASSRLPEIYGTAAAALLRILGDKSAPWETRFVLVPALLELVRVAPKASDVAQAFERLIVTDGSEPVRARATELASAIPALRPTLERALQDRSARVRREAALALGKLGAAENVVSLLSDPWPFVRAEALLALKGVSAPSPTLVASVAKSLKDESPAVRAAAIAALGKYRAVSHHEALVGILYDDDEVSDVRILAARALGEMCSRADTDRLTKLARASSSPVQSQLERDVAFAAIEALSDLHPKDLKDRLAPLLAMGPKAQARVAAERALAAPGSCH